MELDRGTRTSWTRAGGRAVNPARAICTCPDSSGWRSASRLDEPNSVASSSIEARSGRALPRARFHPGSGQSPVRSRTSVMKAAASPESVFLGIGKITVPLILRA